MDRTKVTVAFRNFANAFKSKFWKVGGKRDRLEETMNMEKADRKTDGRMNETVIEIPAPFQIMCNKK
jgi:hypothetical protein